MIKSKPCCDNCPHYKPNELRGDNSGSCLHGYEEYYTPAQSRCSNHPWIRSLTVDCDWWRGFNNGEGAAGNLADSWRQYIAELPFLLDVLAGGGDGAVRKDWTCDSAYPIDLVDRLAERLWPELDGLNKWGGNNGQTREAVARFASVAVDLMREYVRKEDTDGEST